MFFALVATVVLAILAYKLFFPKPKKFWEKCGVREIDTTAAVSQLDLLLGRKTLTEADDYAYDQMGSSEKFCGIMEMGKPVLLVNDIDLMKKILIKDFDHFVDRSLFFTKEDGIIHKMLFTLEGDEWRGVRAAVSPTFATGKIRKMMDIFNKVGNEWVDEFTRKAKASADGSLNIDVLSSVNLYTIEVISTSVLGMSADVIKNPGSAFAKMANKFTEFNWKQVMKFTLRINFPWLSKMLGFSIVDREAVTFFERILTQALQSRLKGEDRRNDFLQLLVEAKKGELRNEEADGEEVTSLQKDDQTSEGPANNKLYLTDEIMNAQSVVFFFGGFSTTSNFITFALYSLALHQDVQNKLREELKKIMREDGNLDYDEVGQHVYLDMVICEVLRKFPVGTRLQRVCTKDYKDPESGLVIPKGTMVGIPLGRLHNDKRFYENPDKFDPEHFTPERKVGRNPYAFMPFGMGPRNCIGMRFSMIEIKSVVAHFVLGFKIEPTEKTPVPLQSQFTGFQIVPPKSLEFKLTPVPKK